LTWRFTVRRRETCRVDPDDDRPSCGARPLGPSNRDGKAAGSHHESDCFVTLSHIATSRQFRIPINNSASEVAATPYKLCFKWRQLGNAIASNGPQRKVLALTAFHRTAAGTKVKLHR
jgi:hypothetical protein